jgi:hypothetical protein
MYQPDGNPDDTCLHEIAHALTPFAGHGPVWQAMCMKIGANPSRFGYYLHGDGIGYKFTCDKCNAVLGTTVRKSRIIGRLRSRCCNAPVNQERN